jgi:hypothetical protein
MNEFYIFWIKNCTNYILFGLKSVRILVFVYQYVGILFVDKDLVNDTGYKNMFNEMSSLKKMRDDLVNQLRETGLVGS